MILSICAKSHENRNCVLWRSHIGHKKTNPQTNRRTN